MAIFKQLGGCNKKAWVRTGQVLSRKDFRPATWEELSVASPKLREKLAWYFFFLEGEKGWIPY